VKSAYWAMTLLLLGACGGGGGTKDGPGGEPSDDVVASISVDPAEQTLAPGLTVKLTANLYNRSGRPITGKVVTWSSDNPARANVTSTGLVQALAEGDARITATADGLSASTLILVAQPVLVADRVELNSIAELIEEGETFQFQATAYDANDNVILGRAVRWTSSDSTIVRVEADGEVTALRPGICEITARVDGAQAIATVRVFANHAFELVYSRASIGVGEEAYSIDINDPAAVPVPRFGPGQTASHPSPSPDGNRIAFVVHGPWDGTYWQSMIFVADRDGSNAERLTYLPARNTEPAWSPDGRRIAFTSQPTGSTAEIWIIDADGSNPVALTLDQAGASKRSPSWSPLPVGGSYRIAYALEAGGTSDIWTMRTDGSMKQPVTTDPAYFDSEPAWSPDAESLVFQRTGGAIFGDLYLVPSSGGSPRTLVFGATLAHGQFGPSWSPDGKLVAFSSKHGDGEHYQIWTVSADGRRLAQRTSDTLLLADPTLQHADPAWLVSPQ